MKSIFAIECIWRLPGFKRLPERLGVTVECGMVYGCHWSGRERKGQPETA